MGRRECSRQYVTEAIITSTTPATVEPGSEGAPLDRLPTELRPAPALLRYYALLSLLAGPFFVIPLLVMYFRYRTLRYAIDDEGISMRWGALFRREVSLNYARIQDIHLSSNVVERWLGLGKIQVQTASGSSGAEMTIEGIHDLDAMRDFLYSRMRGAGTGPDPDPESVPAPGPATSADRAASHGAEGAAAGPADRELAATLREVAAEVRALRAQLTGRP